MRDTTKKCTFGKRKRMDHPVPLLLENAIRFVDEGRADIAREEIVHALRIAGVDEAKDTSMRSTDREGVRPYTAPSMAAEMKEAGDPADMVAACYALWLEAAMERLLPADMLRDQRNEWIARFGQLSAELEEAILITLASDGEKEVDT